MGIASKVSSETYRTGLMFARVEKIPQKRISFLAIVPIYSKLFNASSNLDLSTSMENNDWVLLVRRRRSVENEKVQKARIMWKESGGDVTSTIKALPSGDFMPRERALLKGLNRYGKDKPLEAIRSLGYSTGVFWINAYQSFVWNTVASERIKGFGDCGYQG